MKNATATTTFSPRIRFNWGFHDGTGDATRGSVRDVVFHFDSIYAAGYAAGQKAMEGATERPGSSDAAWALYQGSA